MSEVARLRKEFELECLGIQQALYGRSSVARHKIIARKYAALDTYQEQLTLLVGEQEALDITNAIFSKAVKENA